MRADKIEVRLTPAEKRSWRLAAKRAGQSISEWVRSLVRARLGKR